MARSMLLPFFEALVHTFHTHDTQTFIYKYALENGLIFHSQTLLLGKCSTLRLIGTFPLSSPHDSLILLPLKVIHFLHKLILGYKEGGGLDMSLWAS